VARATATAATDVIGSRLRRLTGARRYRGALGACLVLVACGGSHSARSGPPQAASRPTGPSGDVAAFHWLRPSPPPPGWHTRSLQGGHATLAYPSEFTPISGDFASFSVAVHRGRHYHAFLSIAPQQRDERPAGWAAIRLQFDRREGGTHIATRASAEGLPFRGGPGSCVIDDYNSRVGGRYREIACIVAGPHATTVVVGASALGEWRKRARVLERAVSSFTET